MMPDTYELIRECIRLKRSGSTNEAIRNYLMDCGVEREGLMGILVQAQNINSKMKEGRMKMLGGVVTSVTAAALTIISFMSGSGLAVVLTGAVAGGIGLAVSGYFDWRQTKQYR